MNSIPKRLSWFNPEPRLASCRTLRFGRHGFRSIFFAISSAIFFMGSPLAVAAPTLYKWTDAKGTVHYSESIPPEAVSGRYERLKSEPGAAKREVVPAQATEAEIEQKRLAEQQAKVQQQQLKEARLRRLALKDRYESLSAIDAEILRVKEEGASAIRSIQSDATAKEQSIKSLETSTPPDKLKIAKMRQELEKLRSLLEAEQENLSHKVRKLQQDRSDWLSE